MVRGIDPRLLDSCPEPQGPPNDAPRSVLEDRCVPVLRAVVDAPGLFRWLAPTAVEGRYPRRPRAAMRRPSQSRLGKVDGVRAPDPGRSYQVAASTGPILLATRWAARPRVAATGSRAG